MNVVLIHGFSSQKGEERLKLLIEKIKKELPEAKIIIPNYLEKYARPKIRSGRKSIIEYAGVCKSIIEREATNGSFVLIGYSFGGLIVRALREIMGIQAKVVILVGTPNKGIKLSWLEKLLLTIIRRPFIEDARENSKFLRNLNENCEQKMGITKYYLIAGNEDTRVPLGSVTGIEAQETIIVPTDHSGLIASKLTSEPNAIREIIEILKKEANLSTPSFFIFIRQNLDFLIN